MAKTEAASGGVARARPRGLVTTAPLIPITVMIARGILARRWTDALRPAQDTDQRSR
ncbi:hypothetical protein [Bradyrhizobium sp.]|uniref:hypothetical protein n=1 Tax=Bradyrhizobium sp. TaxID=376 RepID=UPI0039E3837D